MKVVIRTTGDPRAAMPAVRRVLREASPTQPAGRMATLTELYERALGQPRVNTRLMVLFGGTGLALAMLGIYGLLSFVVAGRRREIGIRIALGARSRQVVRAVVGEVSGLAVVGCLAGLAAACASSRSSRAFSSECRPRIRPRGRPRPPRCSLSRSSRSGCPRAARLGSIRWKR